MARTNIYNPTTGQGGYQVEGAAIPIGWTSTPPQALPQATPTTPVPTPTQTKPTTTPTTSTNYGSSQDQQSVNTTQGKLDNQTTRDDIEAAKFQKVSEAYANGSIPLTASQQAQIDGLKQQFTQLIDNQKLINTNAGGVANIRGYQTGAGEYDPSFQTKVIGSIFSAGQAKVADLNIKMADSVAKLTSALQNEDFKAIKASYDAYTEYSDKQKKTFQKTVDDAQARIKEANEAHAKEQERQDKQEVDTRKEINGILETVTKNGAPASVRQAVMNAGTLSDAINAASGHLQSENDILDVQYKRAQISKIYSDMKETGGGGTTADIASLVAYANEYAATGKIPTGLPKGQFGAIAQIAKELPKTPGQIVNVNTNVSPTGDATLQTGLGSIYSAVELAKQLKILDAERWGGVVSGTTGKIFGSEDQQRYVDLRSQIVDLLSRARSGAALTPSEEKRYGDMLPGRFSEPFGLGADSDLRIDNFINNISTDATNKAGAQGWAINGLTKVKVGGQEYTVGDVIEINGIQGRINANGSITQL